VTVKLELEFTETPIQNKEVRNAKIKSRTKQLSTTILIKTVLRDRNILLKPPNMYNVQSFIANCTEPLTFKEAITGVNANEWRHAMNDEIVSLNKNETCKY